jgi:uncharacterized membrane protein YgcG
MLGGVPRRFRLPLRALAALATASAVVAPLSAGALAMDSAAAPAVDTSDFEFRSFSGEYEISRDGAGGSWLSVTETIVPVFPDFDQNRGIVRAIPDLNRDVPLFTNIRSVQDAQGEPVPYEVAWNDGFVELALGDDEFVRGEQTYVIEYTQRNVVGTFSDTEADEFYWDINGTGWDQPVAEVAAVITMDAALADALTGEAACYVGATGATTECGIQQTGSGDGTTFTSRAARLAPRETMTVAIGFASGSFVAGQPDPDYVSIYQPKVPLWSIVLSIVGLVLSGLAVLTGIVLRMLPDGGARGRGTIIPEYSPPDDLNVMAAAHLVGRGKTAIPAQLISLAVRGKIRLLDYPVKADAEYAVQLLTAEGVDPFEHRVLRSLFGAELTEGESRDLPKTDTELAKALQTTSKAAAKSLLAQNLVEPVPKWLRGLWLRLIAIVLVVVAFLNEFLGVPEGAASLWSFLALIAAVVSLVILGFLSRKPTRFTERGAMTNDQLRGIKLYLEVAEEDRIRVLQSPHGAERIDVGDRGQLVKLYERLLPFAVIWGVEKEWMDELAVRMEEAQQAPDWFAGRNGFSSAAVTGALHGIGITASVTSTSSGSWSGSGGSSFSGGSSGGGFSGGGGGGGGGGGR